MSRLLKTQSLHGQAQALGLENPPWDRSAFRFLVVRLSPFRDAVRSSPHLFLRSLIRSAVPSVTDAPVYVDFAFFPSRSDRSLLDSQGLPYLRGIQSLRGGREFDVILISCSYALELVNVPVLLRKSSFPLRSSQRINEGTWPLILLGGSNALASQALIFNDGDSFVDGLFFGEAEVGGRELVQTLVEKRNLPPRERLKALEERVGAFWAATLGAPEKERSDGTFRRVRVARSRVAPFVDGREPTPFIPTDLGILNSSEASTVRLQISWGCPSFCSFCFEGWERKPYRELGRDRILSTARQLIQATGASTVELFSFNFNTHTNILELIYELNGIFDRVNMMSQRLDLLQRTAGMLDCELAGEKRSFTLGIEGISASMRAYYSKGLADRDIWGLLERLFREKVRELKLFYIIAGIETEEDIREFETFCTRLRELSDRQRGGPRVVFSAGYLVRMPFTPLRSAPLILDRGRLSSLAKRIQSAAVDRGFEFRLAMDWDEYVADQLLVAGSYALAEGLETAAQKGAVYDGGIEGPLVASVVDALRGSGELTPGAGPSREAPLAREDSRDREDSRGRQEARETYLKGPLLLEKKRGHSYPLGFLDPPVPPSFLDAAYEAVLLRRDRGTCLAGEDQEGHCLGCSACEDVEERSTLTGHRIEPGTRWASRIAERISQKRRSRPVYLRVRLGESFSGAEPEYLAALLLRAVLRGDGTLIGRLFRIEEVLWTSGEGQKRIGPGVYGDTVLACYGIDGVTPRGEPTVAPETVARIIELLRQFLGAPVTQLPDLSPSALFPRLIEITWSQENFEDILKRVRHWFSELKIAFIEKKGPPSAFGGSDVEGSEAGGVENPSRIFEIPSRDKKKRICEGAQLFSQGPGGQDSYGRDPDPRLDKSPAVTLRIQGQEKISIAPLFKDIDNRASAKIMVLL